MLLQLLVGIALKGEKLQQLTGTGSTYIIVKSVVEILTMTRSVNRQVLLSVI